MLMRCEGRAVPKWQYNSQKIYSGKLSLSEIYNNELGRSTRCAHLINEDPMSALKLFDATVLWVMGERMAINGFESVMGRDYAQTWLCEIVGQ